MQWRMRSDDLSGAIEWSLMSKSFVRLEIIIPVQWSLTMIRAW
jgi:hypothetical protein